MTSYEPTAASNGYATYPPNCPLCDTIMDASELEGRRTFPNLRVGSPVPPRRPLLVWHCSRCGVRSPRLDDCATAAGHCPEPVAR